MAETWYTARQGVAIKVEGDLAGKLKLFLIINNIYPINRACLASPVLLEATFNHHDAQRIQSWLAENGICNEDCQHDLKVGGNPT